MTNKQDQRSLINSIEPLSARNKVFHDMRKVLRLYQQLLDDNPDLEERLNRLPNNVYSGRKRPKKAVSGVFFCYALKAFDKESIGIAWSTFSNFFEGLCPTCNKGESKFFKNS